MKINTRLKHAFFPRVSSPTARGRLYIFIVREKHTELFGRFKLKSIDVGIDVIDTNAIPSYSRCASLMLAGVA
jgi:hypothetical protein